MGRRKRDDVRVDAPMPRDDSIAVKTIADDIRITSALARDICRGITDPKKTAFLLALAQLGNRSRACKVVGVSTVTVWCWRRDDEVFAERFKDAMEVAADLMEDEVFRRGVEGVVEPVFQGGHLVGGIRRYSDNLLMFAMKGARPEKYRENMKIEHGGEIDLVGRLRAARDRALKEET